MKTENNIWSIHENLMLRPDGNVFAIYKVPLKVINTVDSQAKEENKSLVYAGLSPLKKYRDFQLKMLPLTQSLKSKFDKLSLDIDWEDPASELADYVMVNSIDMIEDSMGKPYDYQYFLVVPLKSMTISVDLKSVIKQAYSSSRRRIMSFFGFNELVPLDWYKEYEIQREVLENDISLLNVERLSENQTILLNRLQFMKGQTADEKEEVEMIKSSIHNLDETNIAFEEVNVMKLMNGNQISYVAHLPVATVPENISYLHLQQELQSLPFPIESHFTAQFSFPKGMFSLLAKAKRARLRLKNTSEEAEDAGDMQNTSVVRSKFLLEDLRTLFDEGEPLITYLNTIVITGQTLEELKSRYEMLFSSLSAVGVEIVRANADQVYLFYKNRFTELLERGDKNFLQPMSLEAFCEQLFFVERKVGSETGFYIGRVDNQIASWNGDYQSAINASTNLVFANLLQANKVNVAGKVTSNPHVAITGETGKGKSFLTKLLFTYHSFLKAKILYIDPKAEMRAQYEKVLQKYEKDHAFKPMQDYIKSIKFVTLDSKESQNQGVLDPMIFLPDKEVVDVADSMIDSLLKDNTARIQTGYLEAIDLVLKRRAKGEKVGMLTVFDVMSQSEREEVRNASELLKITVKNSILSLCFSYGEHEGISLDSKTTILEITGLDLPRDNQNVSKSQKKSLVVMYALGYFCKRFGEIDKTEETILFFDEAWFMNTTAVGRSILMELKRVGRSFNNFMVYITQSIFDVQSEDDSTGFGTVFAFNEPTETDAILNYLRIPVNDDTRKWLHNMTMGQCIYYDTFGRKERMTVDGLFPEITELFDTVETKLQSV